MTSLEPRCTRYEKHLYSRGFPPLSGGFSHLVRLPYRAMVPLLPAKCYWTKGEALIARKSISPRAGQNYPRQFRRIVRMGLISSDVASI